MACVEAVVLGGGLNALGVIRSLARHGIRCAVVSHERRVPAGLSRFARPHLTWPGRFEPQALARALGLQPLQSALFLTEELDVQNVLSEAAAWNAWFRTYLHTPDVGVALLDKSVTDGLAADAGVLVPRTVTIRGRDDWLLLDGLRFPCILKPAERSERYTQRFGKAYRLEHQRDLMVLLEQMQELDVALLVQEWIEGADTDIFFNLLYIGQAGELRASFVGRKALCWPPRVGGTAACVGAPEFHDALTAISASFMQQVGFRGLIGIEYKRDVRDGGFYLVEPTVYRTDYQHEIATLNGCPWLHEAFLDMMQRSGPTMPRKPSASACSWVDYPTARYSRALERPSLDLLDGVQRVDAYWRVDDPLPGLVHYGGIAAGKLRSVLRR